jgi:YfiH family protein
MMTDLNVPGEPLWLHQVHGNVAVCSTEAGNLPKADASFTSRVNTPCLVMTADCLPILLTNREGSCVAALHAGWRGLAYGVVENTLKRISSSFPESHWLAWLGPAIGPDVFEVGDEVRDVFMAKDSETQTAFRHSKPGKWLANLYAIARILLQRQGIHQIYGGDYCTYSDAKHFFSHRRDRGMTGRMASLIWFTNPSTP